MKIQQRFATALAALIICCFFTVSAAKADSPSEDAPMFCANIEWSPQGYIVKGTFTEFTPDISRAETLYSLDGEIYQASGEEWNITGWSDGPWTDWDKDELEKFQNQACLHSNSEPLKSYLAGKLDRFYIKLRLTTESGTTYETQAAAIDRGNPEPVPEEITLAAKFAPSIAFRTFRPFSYYGKYQITVSEDAAPEEISAFLPDTLPIEVELQKGMEHVTSGIIDCPVAWKPLAELHLIAGESVTVPDAAEEIVVPSGAILNTPLGIFQLNESLGIHDHGLTDEVRLVLNVIAKDSSPTGALSCDYNGLDMAFHLKPTGATAIRAYTLSGSDTQWAELPALHLLEAVNAQPSTPGSGYTYVLDNHHELYRSYMAACSEGREPSPFFIGLKIEGGVYDGQTLVLPWPDTYELPLDLPEPGGSGGNENNAGADDKGDSTQEGQRPSLPVPDSSGGNEGSSGTIDKGGAAEGQWPRSPVPGDSGGNGGGVTAEDQRPNLPQNTAAESAAPSGGKSSQENLQDRGISHISDRTNVYKQPPMAAQAAAGTIAAAGYPEAASTVNAETGTQAADTAPMPHSAQDSEPDAPAPSGKEETSRLNTEGSRRKFLIPMLTAMAAGICTVGISIAAVADKKGRYNRFKKTREKS